MQSYWWKPCLSRFNANSVCFRATLYVNYVEVCNCRRAEWFTETWWSIRQQRDTVLRQSSVVISGCWCFNAVSRCHGLICSCIHRHVCSQQAVVSGSQQLFLWSNDIVFTVQCYDSAVYTVTGGFKGGGVRRPWPPKMPEVTRSPCQPKMLVCSSTQNVQFKVICSLQS